MNPHRIKISYLFVAGCLLLGASSKLALAAGFDCAKATTDAEKYICTNDELSQLDGILARVYVAKMKRLATAKQHILKQKQKTWLRKRDSCMGHLPNEKWFCVLNAYKQRIVALGGAGHLTAYYKKLCANDDWKCGTVGELEQTRGDLDAAIHYYGIMCKADYDGDYGISCYRKATLLEKEGKTARAKALYIKTCKHRHNNEACGAAQRLTSGTNLKDEWAGLYRSTNGTLFINKESEGVYLFNMDTRWANGSACGYRGSFILKQGKPTVVPEKDTPNCHPEIIKNGDTVSVMDPTGHCRQLCGFRASFEDTFHKDKNQGQQGKIKG